MADCKVTVCCVTYNHKKFIAQALDSFVMQKTTFPFQVLVGDDASTDGTTEIVREYAKKYPEIIKPILHEKNIGAFNNSLSLYQAAKTEYVAICDGDDYWTDPLKLQKQVDFLDAHPDFAVCFHPVEVKWEDNSQKTTLFPTKKQLKDKAVFTLADLFKENFMQTNSILFRWRFKQENISDYWTDEINPGDYHLNLLHAQTGKIGFLPDVMAAYRKQSSGIWYEAGKNIEWYCKGYKSKINFFIVVQKQFGNVMENPFYGTVFKTYYAAVVLNKKEIIDDLESQFKFLSRPTNNRFLLLSEIILLKIKSKLGHKSIRAQSKQKYKALKLYRKWIF